MKMFNERATVCGKQRWKEMITLNSNAESQTASNQQEMPEIFFSGTL